jgi:beta-galactosidase/beta-glucuronidase
MAYGGPTGRRALDTGWVVRMDPASRGVARGYPAGRFNGKRTSVPYSPNATQVSSMDAYRGSVAWFATDVTVGASGDYAIRFESVHHRARVWVDGREVARHTGAYLPFDVRVPLRAGTHKLVVRADWRDPDRLRDEGWFRSWFNFGGLNREVTIRRLGASELDVPAVDTTLRRGAADVTVTVRVRNRARTRALRVAGTLGGTPLRFPAVTLKPFEQRWVTARLTIPRPRLWAPGSPNLADLRLAVPREPGYQARVGLRQLTRKGDRLYLNGRHIRLQGASLQEDARGRGDALTAPEMDALISKLMAIGANATRAQHPLAPALMERLDRAGILVWQGVGPFDVPGRWAANTAAERELAVRRVRLDVLLDRLHPSIVTWNLINEVQGNGIAHGQRTYVVRAARTARALGGDRLIAVDIWGTHLPQVPGTIYKAVDAIGGTNYEGWYDDLWQPRAVVDRRIRAFPRRLRRLFPNKVLAITEFGAEADGANAQRAPGGLRFQSDLLARHIRAYQADPHLTGVLAWSLQDFALRPNFLGGSVRAYAPGLRLHRGINAKGLFTYDGRPKPSAAVVRRLFER